MRFELNLANRPFVNRVPYFTLLGTLAVAAVVFTAWNLALFVGTRAEAAEVESRLAEIAADERELELRAEELSVRLEGVDLTDLREQSNAVNDVLAMKSVSWTRLLERLESLVHWSVALRSIRTNIDREDTIGVSLELRAKNHDVYLEVLDDLEESPCFTNVYAGFDDPEPNGDWSSAIQADYDPTCGQDDRPKTRRTRRGRRG